MGNTNQIKHSVFVQNREILLLARKINISCHKMTKNRHLNTELEEIILSIFVEHFFVLSVHISILEVL